MIVIPNEGKTLWLYWALESDGTDFEDFLVKLYKNNYVPVDASTLANFTISTFTGYADFNVDRADFGSPAIVANVAYETAGVIPSYTCTAGGPEDCYGWLMVGVVSGKVLAAEKFPLPISVVNGLTITLDPFKIALQTLH